MSRSFAVAAFVVLAELAGMAGTAAASGPIANPIRRIIRRGTIHIALAPVASGMNAPNWGITAPGDATRLFVCDQTGKLYAITLADGTKTVFLDTTSLLVPLGVGGPGTYDERGLLGFAFHPSYTTNGLLYAYTSEPTNG